MKYLLDTDHISFLQRRSGTEFARLTVRKGLRILKLMDSIFLEMNRSIDMACCLDIISKSSYTHAILG